MGDNAYKQDHTRRGICVDCGDRAIIGSIRCGKHLYHRRFSQKKYSMAHKEYYADKNKSTRIRYKQEGRCRSCSLMLDPDADMGCVTCVNCRERIRGVTVRLHKHTGGISDTLTESCSARL